MMLSTIQQIILSMIPLVFAITLHEVAHGWVANRLGDPTAKLMGRLTLNPLKHIDILGTIIIPAVLLLLGGVVFGYAKPVPVNWSNLRNLRRDMRLVALSGPIANLLMAIFWTIIARIGVSFQGAEPFLATILFYMGTSGIMINTVLMVLNLIPIPPLDGSRVILSLLDGKAAFNYMRLENYGFWILLALVALGILNKILMPPVMFLFGLFATIAGLPSL